MDARVKIVWYHIVLPLTLFIYLPYTLHRDPLINHWLEIISEYLLLLLTAVSGYIINDFFDRKLDLAVNKHNFFNSQSPFLAYAFSLAMIASTIVLWYYQNPSKTIIILLLAEALLLMLYSLPFVRLKETTIGLVADSLYSRLIPAAVLLLLAAEKTYVFETAFWIFLFSWLLCAGLRNILMHQLDDRKNDKKSCTQSVVIRIGTTTSLRLVLAIILPLEFFFLVLWGIACLPISPILPYTFAGICFVAFAYAFGTPGSNTIRQWKFRALYFLNHIYEEWLPMGVLLSYSCVHPRTFVLLLFHLLLFNKPWRKYMQLLRIILSNLVNHAIYYVFLLFNVNLVAEKTSAWKYIKKKVG